MNWKRPNEEEWKFDIGYWLLAGRNKLNHLEDSMSHWNFIMNTHPHCMIKYIESCSECDLWITMWRANSNASFFNVNILYWTWFIVQVWSMRHLFFWLLEFFISLLSWEKWHMPWKFDIRPSNNQCIILIAIRHFCVDDVRQQNWGETNAYHYDMKSILNQLYVTMSRCPYNLAQFQ